MSSQMVESKVGALKRVIDLTIAIPGVTLVAILTPWIALANRLSGDGGPAFYRAPRVGQGGRMFDILKFRTMRPEVGPGITFRDDPRVTEVGRFLRRSKIDELPQLVNVLSGEMSVVGPRPEAPEYIDLNDPLHRAVIRARPGITGPSQLAYLREEQELADDIEYRSIVQPRKLAIDRIYFQHATPRRDVAIILATLRALVSRAR